MSKKEIRIDMPNDANLDQSEEAKAVAEDTNRETLEVNKLATDLEELRQTLLRRQADFDNYRKRIDKERGEDQKRATGRVIEQLIPVLDGFEQALAAHKEAEYESYRKGFELIYKQLLDNLAKLGAERIDPNGKLFDPHLHQAVDRLESTEPSRRDDSRSVSTRLLVPRSGSAPGDGPRSGAPKRRIEWNCKLSPKGTSRTKHESSTTTRFL